MKKQNAWRDPANLLAAAAGLVSVVSLLVSVRSCAVADRTLDLTRAEFRSQRSIILNGGAGADRDTIQVKSLDSSVVLQEARAIFPDELDKQEWPILPPDHLLHVTVLRLSLQKVIEQRFPRQTDKVTVSLDANVPLVITSLFTAKGDAFEDRSLYRIMYSFVHSGDRDEPPHIEFKGLIYVQRLDPSDDARKLLDQLWTQAIIQK